MIVHGADFYSKIRLLFYDFQQFLIKKLTFFWIWYSCSLKRVAATRKKRINIRENGEKIEKLFEITKITMTRTPVASLESIILNRKVKLSYVGSNYFKSNFHESKAGLSFLEWKTTLVG